MSIKLKFLALILSIILSFAASTAFYYITLSKAETIQLEKESLISLSDSLDNILIESGRLSILPLETQLKTLSEAKESLASEFKQIDSLTALKSANKKIQLSLSRIKSQSTFVSLAIDDLLAIGNTTLEELQSSNINRQSSSYQIYAEIFNSAANVNKYKKLQYNLDMLFEQTKGLDVKVNNSEGILIKQLVEIENEVQILKKRSLLITAGIIVLLLTTGIVSSIFISNGINKSIKHIEKNIEQVAQGDLKLLFAVKTKDEIGQLSQQLNTFISTLNAIINQIKGISNKSIEIKNKLVDVSTHSSASINEMNSEIASIQSQIEMMNDKIGISSQTSENIVSSLNNLDNQIIEQSSMVEEASSAISEMIASIENVSNITSTRSEATKMLVEVAKEGSERLKSTVGKIEIVYSNLDNVGNVAQVINSIAQQTDLLAMNAAIEAAHAGNAGRGFAVVAEEIRKLAEAVNEQSKQIETDIGSITEHIKDASDESNSTMAAFESINSEITNVDNSFAEISSTMNELNMGSKQIIEAMVQLRDIAEGSKDASNTITENSDESNKSVKNIKDISSSVMGSITEIATSIEDINSLMNSINDLSKEVSKISENLNSEIHYFST